MADKLATIKEIRRANLLALMQERGLSQADLARLLLVEPSYVSELTRNSRGAGRPSSFGDRLARKIELAFKKQVGWMDRDHSKGSPAPMADGSAQIVTTPRYRYPHVSFVVAGLPTESVVGAVLGYVEFDTHASSAAFCCQVRGESMLRPDGTGFPDGCYILVEPRRKPKSGDYVVVRFEDGDEATFKQFVVDGVQRMLKPLNPSYPIHVLERGSKAHIAGVVIEKRIVEKF